MSGRSGFAALTVALFMAGCGGAEAEGDDSTYEEEETAGGVQNGTDEDGVSISGLMGTIRTDQVEMALNPRMGRFSRCFAQRMSSVEYIGGNIRMSFRIRTDGSVAWVYPAETDIGDRDTERCILGIAESTRFPRPNGGEAEFSWGFGMDPSEDVRPPLNWDASALAEQEDDFAGLARRCGTRGPFAVTLYIAPEGEVVAAGGTMPDAESAEGLDCILNAVREISMPDPGSYAAKVTIDVR